MIGFVYGQAQYSYLENTIKLEDYVKFMDNSGFSFATITNPNLVCYYKFYKLCRQYNIKPVIGLKVEIATQNDEKNYLLIYAKNTTGLHNLFRLSTIYEDNKILNDEDIKEHNQGLILVSPSFDSDIEHYLMKRDMNKAVEELERLMSLSETFYLGLCSDTYYYDLIMDDLNEMISKYDLKYLPVNKTSYFIEQYDAYKELLKIGSIELTDYDFSLKDQEELEEIFSSVEDPFRDVNDFYLSIEDYEISTKQELPKFAINGFDDAKVILRELSKKGLNKRLIANNKLDKKDEYLKRLEYELSVINKMGYDNYFLIVYEFISYAKNNNILVGPGRGSACSSLVAYCLGITEIDPLQYELLFERFLNEERISMPDIDVDFEDSKRELAVLHVKEKYGNNHVAYISTNQTFQGKNTIRDLVRINHYRESDIPVLIDLYEKNDPELTKEQLYHHPELISLLDNARVLEGLPRQGAIHPSGVIITATSLLDNLPLGTVGEMYQTKLDYKDVEELGYLKFDFLGVSHLSVVKNTIDLIKEKEAFDLYKIPLNDEKTFALLRKKETLGIFQLEGTNISRLLEEMAVSSFDDLIALISLYRPGPIDMIPTYIKRKMGEKFDYIVPAIKPILESTYGVIVYQEQIMRILQVMASYNLKEADIIRRAIAKKNAAVIEEEKKNFVSRSLNNGYKEEDAVEIYSQIAKFMEYGFNKSHSVAYALFVYQMAYLKANYPKEFIISELNNNLANKKLCANYLSYAKKNGIQFYGPNINKSGMLYERYEDGILVPLTAISSVSNKVASDIIDNRGSGYKTFIDFKKRNNLDASILEMLIFANCFSEFKMSQKLMIKYASSVATGFIKEDELIEDNEEYNLSTLQDNEFKALGYNFKYDLFSRYDELKEKFRASDLDQLTIGRKVNIIGIITNRKVITTSDNKKMCFITIVNQSGNVEVTLFPEKYELYKDDLLFNKLYLLNGNTVMRKDRLQITLDRMRKIDDED